ncbi:MAG: mandelate racemase, partial [Myxococcales bacterium]|nr:mandelate racemase [Myxococcales bacterium]
FVDANGAYCRQQAALMAERFAESRVAWFEEPVSSDDLAGLCWMRSRVPHMMDVAAGEYGYDQQYFRHMLEEQAVDVLQADATRCTGISGFVAAGALADAYMLPLSAHCAPSMHAHVGCAVPRVVHLEYFHDHARIEQMLFDGALVPVDGALRPDPSRPGFGLELKRADAARYAV